MEYHFIGIPEGINFSSSCVCFHCEADCGLNQSSEVKGTHFSVLHCALKCDLKPTAVGSVPFNSVRKLEPDENDLLVLAI